MMTEEERLNKSDDPAITFFYLQHQVNDRKLRLLSCATCRDVWIWLNDERSKHAVEVAEQFADGLASQDELKAASIAAYEAAASFRNGSINDFEVSSRAFYTTNVSTSAELVVQLNKMDAKKRKKLLQEFFGNPLNP